MAYPVNCASKDKQTISKHLRIIAFKGQDTFIPAVIIYNGSLCVHETHFNLDTSVIMKELNHSGLPSRSRCEPRAARKTPHCVFHRCGSTRYIAHEVCHRIYLKQDSGQASLRAYGSKYADMIQLMNSKDKYMHIFIFIYLFIYIH